MASKHLVVIDYGMGNLHSVASAVAHVAPEVKVSISADPAVISDADHVIFPGVGAIRDCMAEIRRLEIDKAVHSSLASGKPVLAICVGLQALMRTSEENGGVECLAELPGSVQGFSENGEFQAANRAQQENMKVPHMGWNQVEQRIDHPLWEGIPDKSRFYFVHSYFVRCEDESLVAGRCQYGVAFDAVLRRDNLFACQFHPEKSHTHGLQLLKNFVAWNGQS